MVKTHNRSLLANLKDKIHHCLLGVTFSSVQFSSVQSLSHIWLFATPWIAACQASLSITNSQSLPKPMSVKSVMPSSHLILCQPLLLLPPIPPSIRVFSNESALHTRWPKYWSFSFSISPSNEHPGLISFRMDWLDLLAVQGTFKSLLQHHSSKASILQRSAFFTVQLSDPNMTTGKTIALTRWTFVGKVMSLHFNMLSRLVITFFPRSVTLFSRYSVLIYLVWLKLSIFWPLPSYTPLLHSPGHHSFILFFWEFDKFRLHMRGTIKYFPFCVCLISLSIKISGPSMLFQMTDFFLFKVE